MYLSMLFPRSKKICVFGAWLGDKFADNSKMLFLEAQERKELLPVWIARQKDVVEEVRSLGYRSYTWFSPLGIWYQLRAKYAVMSNGISDFKHAFLGGAVFINLWHGVPLKKIGYDDYYEKNWDSKKQAFRDKIINVPLGKQYVVATSETIGKIYESAFRVPKERILCLGQPRNDVFYQNSSKAKTKEKAKAKTEEKTKEKTEEKKKQRKIILYAPTHRKEGKHKIKLSEILDLRVLNEFCEKNGYDFLVKKHFYHREEKEELQEYNRVFDITNEICDTQELLMQTDILITDYSSIYIDYLLLDRPILFYDYDYEDYLREDREMYFEYDKVTPGQKVKNFEELAEALENIETNGTACQSAEREKVRRLFYCTEGQNAVGEKLLDMIIEGKLR